MPAAVRIQTTPEIALRLLDPGAGVGNPAPLCGGAADRASGGRLVAAPPRAPLVGDNGSLHGILLTEK